MWLYLLSLATHYNIVCLLEQTACDLLLCYTCISHHHKNLEEVKSELCPLSTSTRSFHTSTQFSSTADCVTVQWCRSMNAECERWDNSVSSQILGKTRVSQEALLKSHWGLFQTSARALLDAVKSLSPPTQLLSTWWCLVTFSESPFIHQLSVACEGHSSLSQSIFYYLKKWVHWSGLITQDNYELLNTCKLFTCSRCTVGWISRESWRREGRVWTIGKCRKG